MKKNFMSKNLRKLKGLATMTMLVVVSLLFSQEVNAQIPSLVDGATASQRLTNEVLSLQAMLDNQDFRTMTEKEVDATVRYYSLLLEDVTLMRPEEAVFSTYERTIQSDFTTDNGRGLLTAPQTKALPYPDNTGSDASANYNPYIKRAIETLKR